MCLHAHDECEAISPLWTGVHGPLKGPVISMGFDAL